MTRLPRQSRSKAEGDFLSSALKQGIAERAEAKVEVGRSARAHMRNSSPGVLPRLVRLTLQTRPLRAHPASALPRPCLGLPARLLSRFDEQTEHEECPRMWVRGTHPVFSAQKQTKRRAVPRMAEKSDVTRVTRTQRPRRLGRPRLAAGGSFRPEGAMRASRCAAADRALLGWRCSHRQSRSPASPAAPAGSRRQLCSNTIV